MRPLTSFGEHSATNAGDTAMRVHQREDSKFKHGLTCGNRANSKPRNHSTSVYFTQPIATGRNSGEDLRVHCPLKLRRRPKLKLTAPTANMRVNPIRGHLRPNFAGSRSLREEAATDGESWANQIQVRWSARRKTRQPGVQTQHLKKHQHPSSCLSFQRSWPNRKFLQSKGSQLLLH